MQVFLQWVIKRSNAVVLNLEEIPNHTAWQANSLVGNMHSGGHGTPKVIIQRVVTKRKDENNCPNLCKSHI